MLKKGSLCINLLDGATKIFCCRKKKFHHYNIRNQHQIFLLQLHVFPSKFWWCEKIIIFVFIQSEIMRFTTARDGKQTAFFSTHLLFSFFFFCPVWVTYKTTTCKIHVCFIRSPRHQSICSSWVVREAYSSIFMYSTNVSVWKTGAFLSDLSSIVNRLTALQSRAKFPRLSQI